MYMDAALGRAGPCFLNLLCWNYGMFHFRDNPVLFEAILLVEGNTGLERENAILLL